MQRLMGKGYGFAAEGDWKTAAMLRIVKLMTAGVKDAKGTSFMEDYTYNLVPGKEGVLETHMLEICPSIAEGDINIRVNPLGLETEKIRQGLYLQRKKEMQLPPP